MTKAANSSKDATREVPAEKILIGWREFVDLPEWGIVSVRAKIDTGARTSALHVEHLDLLPDGLVRFEVVPDGDVRKRIAVVAELIRVSRVRPSTGVLQRRHVVSTTMRLGPVEKVIQLSLVSRQGMLCPMLVGRRALNDQFIVDPAAKYLLRRRRYRRTKS